MHTDWKHRDTGGLDKIVQNQARLTPFSPAIEWHSPGDRQPFRITYAEFNEQAGLLAQHLASLLQAVDTTLVAICLPKSPQLYITILATLKLGFAWTPIDPSAPEDRKVQLLRALGSCALFVADDFFKLEAPSNVLKVISPSQVPTSATLQLDSDLPLNEDTNPSAPCHILWTSGSTGLPKGVIISHLAVANNVAALSKLFNLQPSTRTLQFAHFTFDVFALDIFMTWSVGGCIVVAEKSDILLDLSSFMCNHGITYAQLTPSVIELLDQARFEQHGGTLQVLASSGEAMTQSIVDSWATRTSLWNIYGPCETDVVTAHNVTGQSSPSNIGCATEGMTVLILDDKGERVANGTAGELCVHGPQVMNGYLDGSSDSRSSAGWFRRGSDQWFYRTGDFGRMETSGNIDLIGRRDHQVKVRGHRVNLAEIESLIRRDSGILRAVCVYVSVGRFQNHLCAFLQPRDTPTSASNTGSSFELGTSSDATMAAVHVQTALQDVLSPAVIPSQWWCGTLPVTTSGKIDRNRIASWLVEDAEKASQCRAHPEAPTNAISASLAAEIGELNDAEQKIRLAWGSLLYMNPLDIPAHLSFYAAGGHSVLAIQLVADLRSSGIPLTLAELHAHNTIEHQVHFAVNHALCTADPTAKQTDQPFALVAAGTSTSELISKIADEYPISRDRIENVYPCTALQQGLIAASLQKPGRYICDFRFRLRYGVSPSIISTAWTQLVALEPILRTRIVYVKDLGMLQVVLVAKDCAPQIDPRAFLNQHEVLGSALWSFQPNETSKHGRYDLDLHMHHALIDAWQVQLLLRKLNVLCDDLSKSHLASHSLKPGPSFTRFIRHVSQDVPFDSSAEFWTSALADAVQPDFPAKPTGVDADIGESGSLSGMIELDYRDIAAQCDVPPGVVLSAIWDVVYSELAGDGKVTYGTIMSGRDAPVDGIEAMFGPTFAVIPRSSDVDPDMTFEQLLRQQHASDSEMRPHLHFGLQNMRRLNEQCRQVCDLRTLFTVQAEMDFSQPTDALSLLLASEPSYEYPLVVSFKMQADCQFVFEAHHWESMIRIEEVQCIMDQIVSVAHRIAEGGVSQTVQQLSMVSDSQVAESMQNHAMPEAQDMLVHDIFLQAAHRNPHAVAIYDQASDASLTYETVDRFSATLSAELRARGAQVEDVIPMCIEKGAGALVAMLGILRAGCAYVPIDPDHPIHRRRALIERVRATIIVCSTRQQAEYQEFMSHVIVGDEYLNRINNNNNNAEAEVAQVFHNHMDPAIPAEPSYTPPASRIGSDVSSHPPSDIDMSDSGTTTSRKLSNSSSYVLLSSSKTSADPTLDGNSPAFILYTSGSTGEPKGVVLTHQNIATAIYYLAKSFHLGLGIRTLQFSAYTFDMSLTEIYMAWARGGCVCIPSPHARMNRLSESLRDMRIDTVVATPTVASLLKLEDAPFLKTIVISGERLTKAMVDRFSHAVDLYQCYGPTEAALSVTSTRVPAGCTDLANIGPPINARIWILDDQHKIVPPGRPGEIAIAGPTVAKGYFNNDELTKSRFIDLKHDGDTTLERVYLTGDIGRLDCNGSVRIQGRRDFQVKIRGIRVELGEIEDKIAGTDPAVISQVAVSYAEQRLTAFVSLKTSIAWTAAPVVSSPEEFRLLETDSSQNDLSEKIACHLRTVLPKYMIPSRFVYVNVVPKTTSGKVDLKRLDVAFKEFSHKTNLVQEAGIASDHPTGQNKIPAVFRELLGKVLDIPDGLPLDVSDSFIDLGGDSFTAIRLVAAARDIGYITTVPDIFSSVRIGAIWEHMVTSQGKIQEPPRVFAKSAFALKDFIYPAEIRAGTGLEPYNVEDIYPCTPFQEGIFALGAMNPGLYIARSVFKVASCDGARLEKALRLVIEQTPILRTTILSLPKFGTLQVVERYSAENFDSAIISRNPSLEAMLAEKPSISGPYLGSFGIAVADDDSCYISLTLSHAIYDGWSHDLLLEDISTAYNTKGLEKSDVSFQSFIANQRSQQRSSEHINFWKDYLHESSSATYPDASDVDGTCTVVANRVCSHENDVVKWPKEVQRAAVLHAAWTLVLAKYENLTDPCYGTILGGRDVALPGVERVRGPTMSAAICRNTFEPTDVIPEFIKRVETTLARVKEHGSYGLQNISQIDQHTASGCAIRTMLVIQPQARRSTSSDGGICFEIVDDSMSHGYPVTLVCEPRAGDITTRLYYDDNWVSSEQAERITKLFYFTLGRVIEGMQLNRTVGEIDMVPPMDLEQIYRWNDIVLSPIYDNIYGLVRRSIQSAPHAPAIETTDGQVLTYSELDHLVSSLAAHLYWRGIGHGDTVLIQMVKSRQQVVAVLAVLLIGAAFVPVDLQLPPARARKIVRNTNANWALVDNDSMFYEGAAEELELNIVTVGSDVLRFTSAVTDVKMLPDIQSGDLAYILFTSGSTGEPKGICTPHITVCTAIVALAKELGLSPSSRVLAFSSLTFDASILELFGTLVAGGLICLPTEQERFYALEDTIRATRVNWLGLTPGVANAISPANVPSVKALTLFGEAIPRYLVDTWSKNVHLAFAYGPTETTIIVTVCQDSSDPYCIGKAIGTTSTWIVDTHDHNRLVPIGAVGELVCMGPSTTQGYAHDPDRTSKAFISPPKWANDISKQWRAYKTGDLVRYYPDGSIRILGRADGQLKIRGKRVELREIDAVVTQTGLTTGVVTDVLKKHDAQLLVCFVTMKDSSGRETHGSRPAALQITAELRMVITKLRESLEVTLPSHMLPWAIFPVDRLPRGSSGKIDRQLLRQLAEEWEGDHGDWSEQAQELPTEQWTDSEQLLRSIWADSLQIDQSRIHQRGNFTRLGGDSLSMMRVVAHARAKGYIFDHVKLHHNMELSQMAMLLSPSKAMVQQDQEITPFASLDSDTITDLKARVTERCKLTPDSITDMYSLTPAQMALMTASIKNTGTYINRMEIAIPESISLGALETALDVLVEHQEVLRTVMFADLGEHGIQAVLRAGNKLVVLDSSIKVLPEMTEGALPRFFFQGRSLILSIHHAAMDAASIRMVLADLECALSGTQLPAGPRFAQFVQHTDMLRAYDKWQRPWAKYLDRSLPSLYPRAEASEVPEVCGSLKATLQLPKANDSSWTAADLIGVAVAILLRKSSNSTSVCFGMALSGRNEPVAGIEEIRGPTLATIPIVCDTDEGCSVDDMLAEHQSAMRLIGPYQQVGMSAIASLNECGRQAALFTTLLIIHPNVEEQQGGMLGRVDIRGEVNKPAYPVEIEFSLSNDGAAVTLAYDGSIVGRVQAQWLLDHLQHIIENQMTTSNISTLALKQVQMLTDNDLRQIDRWNAKTVVPAETSLCAMFGHIAQSSSNDVAIESHDGTFTYSQLDTLSSAVACRIHESGGKGLHHIPLMFEKSAICIIVIMGIMKSGAAYVPLDLAHPEARLQAIKDDIGSNFVVCSASVADKCNIWRKKLVVDLDDFAGLDEINFVAPEVLPSSTAYVMFTSGSTGRPKGVVLSHQAVSTSVRDQIATFEFSPAKRLLHFCSYTFDVSVMEIFATLCSGATLIIPNNVERVMHLNTFINSKAVDTAILTATAVRSFLAPSRVGRLKQLILVGEPITASLIEQYHGLVQICNDYGPTETCVQSATNVNITSTTKATNVGHAISSNLWIVDQSDPTLLCPLGVPGQLLISGPTLADCYIKDPERTGAAFLDGSSLSWTTQMCVRPERLYQTGDLAQYGPTGQIHILGRLDTQIKLRGLRIETREIESVMENSDPMIEAGVALTKTADDEDKLVGVVSSRNWETRGEATVISQPSQDIVRELKKLTAYLKRHLPAYMCPSRIFPMTCMPVNASGKLDRIRISQILSTMDKSVQHRYTNNDSEDVSRTPVVITGPELELRETWATILKIEQDLIMPQSSFFALGGDSLRAIKLSSAITQQGKDLPVQSIFRLQTLSEMAKSMQSNLVQREPTSVQHLRHTSLRKTTALVNQMSDACQILPQEVEQIYPCSPLQSNLFVASLLSSGSYVACLAFELGSSIDYKRFHASWEAVYQRHQILRTRIVLRDGADDYDDCIQVVAQQRIPWKRFGHADDCGIYPPVISGGELSHWNLAEQDGVAQHFVLFCHHSIYDDVTLRLIFGEFQEAYSTGFISGAQPLHMGHYLGFLEAVDADDTKRVWQNMLSQPIVRHFPKRTGQPAKKPCTNAATATRVANVGASPDWRSGLTVFIRAAWILTIARHQSDEKFDYERVCFGSVVSGRSSSQAQLDRISGPVICSIPTAESVYAEEPLSMLLDRIREQTIAVMGHEHIGLRTIRRYGRNEASSCDFNNMLIIEASQEGSDILAASPFEMKDFTPIHTKLQHPCALMVNCSATQTGIDISASYDSREIEGLAVDQLLGQFQNLLEWLYRSAHNPQLDTADAFAALSTENEKALTVSWNPIPEPANDLLHARFCTVAKIHPERQAIFAADRELSYAQLERETAILAQNLIDRGVQAGCTVPICFDKSSYMLVAQLAVLRAGGAYVPISPYHPPSRREHIRGCCNTEVCLTSTTARALFLEDDTGIIVVNEDYFCNIAASTSDLLRYPPGYVPVSPRSPAYILYTSGSTGTPKGVCVSHGAITLCVAKHALRFGFDRPGGLRSLQFSNFTFDDSLMDIFPTLSFGGCVCVPSEDDRFGDISKFIETSQAEIAMLTPTVVDMLSPARVPSLVTVIVGGEPMTPSVINKWCSPENKPLRTCHNTYGPTEASVHVAACVVDSRSSPSNIGRAVFGAQLFIAEPSCTDRLTPLGCVGELIIAGPSLAEGYVGQPQQTAAVFVPAPPWLPAGWGDRVYRTGDLARFAPDGQIECLGRIDSQVKLHGVRIELGEIESVARTAPDVIHAAAIVAKRRGEERLALFYELGAPGNLTQTGLRAHLRASLPVTMVPSILIQASIPLTPTGKLDRKALIVRAETADEDEPKHQVSTSSVDGPPVKTRKMRELELQEVWSRVLRLGLDSINLSSDFFTLGADSLDVIKLVSQLQRNGHNISYPDVYTCSQFAPMVTLLEDQTPSRSRAPQPFELLGATDTTSRELIDLTAASLDLQPARIVDMYPCSHMQSSLIVASTLSPGSYWCTMDFDLAAEMDCIDITLAWDQLVERHAILRTIVINHDVCGSTQVVLDTNPAHLLSGLAQPDGQMLGRPLHEFTIVSSTDKRTSSVRLRMHHAIYDHWVLQALMADLRSLCLDGSFSGISVPYSCFIQFQQQHKNTSADYWVQKLAGASITAFPFTGSSASRANTLTSSSLEKTIILEKLDDCGPSASTATIVHCAYAIVLSRYAAIEDVCYPTIQSGRNIPLHNVADVMGPTISSMMFRADCSGSVLVRDLIESAHGYLFESSEHQGTPSHVVKEALGATGSLDMSCMLVVQSRGDHSQRDDDSSTDYFTLSQAKFDNTGSVVVEASIGDNSEVNLQLLYAPEVLDSLQAELLLEHLCSAMHGLNSCGPHATVESLSFFSELDAEIVSCVCGTTVSEPGHATVAQMFRDAASRWPQALAVEAHDGRLTYRELLTQAENLATLIHNEGNAHEHTTKGELRVAACAERGLVALIMQVAIFLMGRTAFIPLGPDSPLGRNAQILEDSRADIVLCSHAARESVDASVRSLPQPNGRDRPIVLVVDLATTKSHGPVLASSFLHSQPEHIAYVLYTFGSTGQSNGCMMAHGVLATTITALTDYKCVQQGGRVLWSSPWVFDSHLSQIWEPLTVGGIVCVPDEHEMHGDSGKTLASYAINHAFFTPSMASLVDFTTPSVARHLRTLAMGGESINFDVRPLLRASIRLINEYGQSESCVCVTAHDIGANDTTSNNIGRSMIGVACWTVQPGSSLQLAPIGTVGELVVGGTLARGYLNRHEETDAVFVDAPEWATAVGCRRLYMTGDLVRQDSRGNFHYLGRKDSQIKIKIDDRTSGDVNGTPMQSRLPDDSTSLSASERNMQRLWAGVLKCEPSILGPDSDFFAHGDSIQVMSLVGAAAGAGFALKATQIFERPLLRSMAFLLDQRSLSPASSHGHTHMVLHDPKPFSLLAPDRATLIEKLLRERLPPQARIEDVYPLTPFQTMATHSNQSNAASYYAWFMLQIDGPLDVDHLRRSCEETVRNHPLLRTVFFFLRDSWYQAPINNLDLDFLAIPWSGSRDVVPNLLQSNSSPIGIDFKCPTAVRLLQTSQESNLLAIGLSHAQYDGISYPAVPTEILARYRGCYSSTDPRPRFSRLLEFKDSQASTSKAYWRQCLAGSAMVSPILKQHDQHKRQLLNGIATQMVAMPNSPLPHGATFHEALTLAWALTIGAATTSTDLLFGTLTSGRNAAVKDIDVLPGPCINIYPVRVQFDSHALSMHDALRAIRNSRVQAMPHEHMGIGEIIRDCTDWDAQARLSSVIQHQNIDIWTDDPSSSSRSYSHTGGSTSDVRFSNAGTIGYPMASDEIDLWIILCPDLERRCAFKSCIAKVSLKRMYKHYSKCFARILR